MSWLLYDQTEVEGPWVEEDRGEERLFSLLVDTVASTQRSQPMPIASNRAREAELNSSSVPSIPNPFPELCSPAQSPVQIGSFPPPSRDKHLVKVYDEDSNSRSLWVSRRATAREVCHMLVQTTHCRDQENWALVELHPTLGLERCLEDHEVVLEVKATWFIEADAKFVFRKNYAKYEFFRKPMLFFPENMISDSADVTKGMTSSELVQNLLQSGTCPEVQGFLQVKESSHKAWRKAYFFLRRSGLYCSSMGSSKEPRHLQYMADLEELNVYMVANSRKLYGAPTDLTFCVKPSRDPVGIQGLKFFCAENEETRTCWMSAFRLFKYGRQLQRNYHRSKLTPQCPQQAPVTDSEPGSEASLVAMDFSGKAGGRVIQNLNEAQIAEREEGQAWRKREAMKCSLSRLNPGLRPSSIHRIQPWFHGGLSRQEAVKLMGEQGLVDGMFLIRESQKHAQCFVLCLCHKRKTKNYLVVPVEEGGRKYYTIDDGCTRFIDLLQLVEHHQINKGNLPVSLKHPCIRVAL